MVTSIIFEMASIYKNCVDTLLKTHIYKENSMLAEADISVNIFDILSLAAKHITAAETVTISGR